VKKQYAVPKAVTIGKTKIKIGLYDSVFVGKDDCRGCYNWADHTIAIAKQAKTRQHNTLWHEITHAILHDMGEGKLNRNEKFVSGFADRLEQAIRTAKF
jgi:Zn-dependent peptidase ImmA (M78 family)